MNLIEQLGGYKAAKEKLKSLNEQLYKMMEPETFLLEMDNQQKLSVVISAIEIAMLEYRRQHNIFEEGDKIVFIDDFMHGELITVAWTRKGEVWMDGGAKRCTDLSMIRHATDAEIQAGKRL